MHFALFTSPVTLRRIKTRGLEVVLFMLSMNIYIHSFRKHDERNNGEYINSQRAK